MQGKVPKNNFGNIDLYVPSMLPKGAVHIPCQSHLNILMMLEFTVDLAYTFFLFRQTDKGVAKIARKLGFDYAEAVVSVLLSFHTPL